MNLCPTGVLVLWVGRHRELLHSPCVQGGCLAVWSHGPQPWWGGQRAIWSLWASQRPEITGSQSRASQTPPNTSEELRTKRRPCGRSQPKCQELGALSAGLLVTELWSWGLCGVRHLSLKTWLTVPSLVEFSTGSLEQASFNQNRLFFTVSHPYGCPCSTTPLVPRALPHPKTVRDHPVRKWALHNLPNRPNGLVLRAGSDLRLLSWFGHLHF